jgi:hypothetical protein
LETSRKYTYADLRAWILATARLRNFLVEVQGFLEILTTKPVVRTED